jgi:hypothetical protein
MILNTLLCRGFSLCTGYLAPNEFLINLNKAATEVNQAVYVISGNAVATAENQQPITLNTACLTDVSNFAGIQITYTAGPEGAAWVALNPIPETKRYSTNLVQSGTAVEVAADGAECAIVCLFGNINVSGKTVAALSYARVLPTKTVMLETPQNSVALIIKAV